MTSRWQTILAIDSDRWAAETYRANFPSVDVRCGRVADFIDALPDADMILGGPPCQSFSRAGKGKGHADDRNGWPEFVAAVRKVRPRMFLAENVAGMLDRKHIRYISGVVKELGGIDYRVDVRELDTVNFGAPQFRQRAWVWGIRNDVNASHAWPKPTHCWPAQDCMFGGALTTAPTVREALGLDGTIFRKRGGSWGERPPFSRFSGDARTDRDISDEPSTTIAVAAGNQLPELHEYRWSDAMRAKHPPADPNEPSPTVQAKWFKGGAEGLVRADVPDRQFIRRLTPDECARLQSLPDDFRWPDGISKTAKYKVVGNGWNAAMSDALSRALAAADPASRTVIDLFCGGGCGAVGWHGRFWRAPDRIPELANSS